jgi:hypothetical protein
MDWFLETWAALAGERPPLDAQVLLADNHTVWQPAAAQLRPLWSRLRITVLHAIWHVRSNRHDCNGTSFAATAAAMAVSTMRKAIKRDWLRCTTDVRAMSDTYHHWFRGRDPSLDEREFEQLWGAGGLLCLLQPGAGGRSQQLVITLDKRHPVPIPG